jgi:hypothetical protein
LLDHLFVLHLAQAEEVRPVAAVHLLDDRRDILDLQVEDGLCPALLGRELQIGGNGRCRDVEGVLDIPERYLDFCHVDVSA